MFSGHLGLSLFPPRAPRMGPIFSSSQLLGLEKDLDLTAQGTHSFLFLKQKLWAMVELLNEGRGRKPILTEHLL